MINALVKIEESRVGERTVPTVSARELHEFLEVGKDFSTWIKDRISQYEFIENKDFIIFPDSGENSTRGRPTKEYHISVDMAKEVSMVERNEKGRQARRYFIECETKLKEERKHLTHLEMMVEQAQALVAQERKTIEAKQLAQAAVDIATAAADKNSGNSGFFTIRGFCNLHNLKFPIQKLKSLGVKAAALSNKHKVSIYKVPDEMFGRVNQYHENVLMDVFGEFNEKAA